VNLSALEDLRTSIWALAAAVVAGAWVAGYLVWDQGPDGDFRASFDSLGLIVIGFVGLPLCLATSFAALRGRSGLAYLLFGGTVFLLAAVVFFAWFGGFCLEPGETCATSWASRVAALAAAWVVLATGWGTTRHLRS